MPKASKPVGHPAHKTTRAQRAHEDFERNGQRGITPCAPNIRRALKFLGVALRHDVFANRMLINGRFLGDAELDNLYVMLDEKFEFRPRREYFETVVRDEARKSSFHPVCDYLNSLTWDGKTRLDTWLCTYAGAKNTAYTQAVGRITLIAAVRRVRHPGCKFDEMLILESEQGLNKSSALGIIAVREEWFSDDLPLNAKSKEAIEQLSGRWIIEAGELRGMRKGDVDHLKSFLSRRVDRARLAYGRLTSEYPRQCVIIGTTNHKHYLKDQTGNRRFWPVAIKEFDLQALERDRDQLWAEAAAAEAKSESIRLDPQLYEQAAAEQGKREVSHPWLDILSGKLDSRVGKLRTADAWLLVGFDDSARATQEHQATLGDCMRKLGFERTKKRFGGKNPENAYVRGTGAEQRRQIYVRKSEEGQHEVWQDED